MDDLIASEQASLTNGQFISMVIATEFLQTLSTYPYTESPCDSDGLDTEFREFIGEIAAHETIVIKNRYGYPTHEYLVKLKQGLHLIFDKSPFYDDNVKAAIDAIDIEPRRK